jgi:hypothetical protein
MLTRIKSTRERVYRITFILHDSLASIGPKPLPLAARADLSDGTRVVSLTVLAILRTPYSLRMGERIGGQKQENIRRLTMQEKPNSLVVISGRLQCFVPQRPDDTRNSNAEKLDGRLQNMQE